MRQFSTIFKREFAAYFNSPIAYVYIIVFLLITSGLYMSTFFLMERADMRSYFAMMPLVLAVFIPAITMRLWAEERNLGTLSLLLSLPMKSVMLVLAKFAAALAFYLISLACTGTIPVLLALVGNPDWGAVITGYIGTGLVGCLFLAVGIFISALFKDQIVAFILSIMACLATALLGNDFVAAFIDGWVAGLGQVLQKGLGASYHFAAFERGLIDSSDVIYFLSFTAALLILNGFTLDSKIKLRSPKRFYVATVFLLGIAFMLNLIVSDLRPGRIDLTEGRIYTVSPATVRILSTLKVPVEVNYYVSEEDKMPSALKSTRRDVEDKLSDLARLSPNFTYHVYNPAADADKLEELARKGIVPFQAQSIERDSLDIKRVYSAVSITYLDKKTEVIPQVVPQNLGDLEYQIVSKVHRMTLEESPKVAMLAPVEAPDPRFNDPRMRQLMMQMGQTPPQMTDNYQKTMQILRGEDYQVSRIALSETEPLPQDTQTLVILQPDELDPRQIYEIQRFLAKGGRVILAAQTYKFNLAPTQQGDLQVTPEKLPENVNQLLEPYGVQLDAGILMDEHPEILNVSMPRRIGGLFNAMVSTPVKMPMQIRITADDLNPDMSITNRISGLLYLWGCALDADPKVLEKNQLKSTTLADSGPTAWTIPFKNSPLSADDLLVNRGGQKSYPLALQLEGQFPDPYQGKDVPPWPEAPPPPGQPPEPKEEKPTEKAPALTREPGKLIVVGCSRMFADNAIGALDNGLFFQNMVDGLALSEDLIGIRTKSQPVRYIATLTPGQKLVLRFLALGLAPLLMTMLGVARFLLRKRRREHYEKSIQTAAAGG